MAVFRKFLSATKGKMKTPNIKYRTDGPGPSTSGVEVSSPTEEFERRKQEWQDELEEMSEFLLIKSTAEQMEEGSQHPVDTAFVEDKDGMPFLKCLFDVHHFNREDITLDITDEELLLTAKHIEDKDDRVYTKTMTRKLELPKYADSKMLHCDFKDGLLIVEMPFHLPPQKKPQGPNVFPILTDSEGRRKIRLMMYVGTEFASDDIAVETNGKRLFIKAAYDAEVGKYGHIVNAREFKREYILPDNLQVDHVNYVLSPDGRLFVELFLKDDELLKCTMTAEEVQDT